MDRNNPTDPKTWDNEYAVTACWELWCIRRAQWQKSRVNWSKPPKLSQLRRAALVRRIQVYGPEEVAQALLGVYCAGLEKPTFHEATRESQLRKNVPYYAKLYREITGSGSVAGFTAGRLF